MNEIDVESDGELLSKKPKMFEQNIASALSTGTSSSKAKAKVSKNGTKEVHDVIEIKDGEESGKDGDTSNLLLDVTPFICAHGRLNPSCLEEVRAISTCAVDYFEDTFPNRVIRRLKPTVEVLDILCCDCVAKEILSYIQDDVLKDDKANFRLLKRSFPRGSPSGPTGTSDDDDFFVVEQDVISQFEKLLQGGDLKIECLNKGVYCEHGHRSCDDSKSRLVSKEAWDILSDYLHEDAVFLTNGNEYCSICKVRQHKENVKSIQIKEDAQDEVQHLILLRRTGQPAFHSLSSLVYADGKLLRRLFLLSYKFVKEWRAWSRKPSESPHPPSLFFEDMLCPHKKLLVDVSKDLDDSFSYPVDPSGKEISSYLDFRFCTESLWEKIVSIYPCDNPITITINNTGIFESSLDVCKECREDRLHLELLSCCEYGKSYLHIVKMDNAPEEGKQFIKNETRRGRRTRHAKNGNSKVYKVQVDSNTMLLDLKAKLINVYHAMPLDMHLYYEGRLLEDGNKSLGELLVPVHASLALVIDATQIDEPTTVESVENGFKGTLLTSFSSHSMGVAETTSKS
eukprot:m.73432 g.73432  ORF g.73432 m.73432 type:complete len:568 (+) comp8421_c2_seq2:1025-2728(+)